MKTLGENFPSSVAAPREYSGIKLPLYEFIITTAFGLKDIQRGDCELTEHTVLTVQYLTVHYSTVQYCTGSTVQYSTEASFFVCDRTLPIARLIL